MKNFFTALFLLVAVPVHAQFSVDMIGFKAEIFPALNTMRIPTRLNTIEIEESQIQAEEFEEKSSSTVGISTTAVLWPLYTDYFGYGLIYSASEGWLFTDTHSFRQQGYKIQTGLPQLKLNLEFSQIIRKSAGYWVEYQSATEVTEKVSRSKYEVERHRYSVQVFMDKDTYVEAGYLKDEFTEIEMSAEGYFVGFNLANNLTCEFEIISKHPELGYVYIGISEPPDGIRTESTFFNLTVGKRMQFAKSWKRIVNGLIY